MKNSNNTIYISVGGGLGNQMFQYAFYKYLVCQDRNVYLDIGWFNSSHKAHETYRLNYFPLKNIKFANLLSDFSIYKNTIDLARYYSIPFLIKKNIETGIMIKVIITKIIRRILKFVKIPYKLKNIHYVETKENRNFYLDGLPCYGKSIYMSGWFQSHKYLRSIREIILSDFSFELDIPESVKNILNDIKNSDSVSFHVRRGDFVNSEEGFKLFGMICTQQYYVNSYNYLQSKYSDLRYFVFTNDIEWTKANFIFLENYTIVDTSKESPSDYYDLFLMTQTKHNIIANSTFSWWGAWLNQNPSKIVITPEKWLGDDSLTTDEVCPPEWVRISRF